MPAASAQVEIQSRSPRLVSGRVTFPVGASRRTPLIFKLSGPNANELELFFNLSRVSVSDSSAQAAAPPDDDPIVGAQTVADGFTKFIFRAEGTGSWTAFEESLRAVMAEQPIIQILDDKKARRQAITYKCAFPYLTWEWPPGRMATVLSVNAAAIFKANPVHGKYSNRGISGFAYCYPGGEQCDPIEYRPNPPPLLTTPSGGTGTQSSGGTGS